MIIRPEKPKIIEGFYCLISLKKTEVDITDIETFALENNFTEQTNRHITIIGGLTEDFLNKMYKSKNAKEKPINNIKKALNSLNWSFTLKNIYHIKKKGIFDKKNPIIEKRETLIRVIKMADMENFYKKINKILGTNFSTQFPHITLFTKGEQKEASCKGIPISSEKKFRDLNPTETK